ncbi:MAG: DDE-type integrase/transposase/recombinase [Thermodesulfobacteriota bacterium]|nr:DDE-type integrase/transposase/recombinase [Thermodesulfobacteriota bacterium]
MLFTEKFLFYQGQVDFGELQVEQADGSIKKRYLFSMVLGYSRKIYGELIERCDLPTFLDCHIRAFEYFGGVPEQLLYDRMRNVYIGKIAGKKILLRVKDKAMTIFSDDSLVVAYEIPEGKGHLVQDKRFYEALKKDHEMNRRK